MAVIMPWAAEQDARLEAGKRTLRLDSAQMVAEALRCPCNRGPENYLRPLPGRKQRRRHIALDAAAAVIQSGGRRGSPPNLTGPSQRVRHEAKGTESSSRCQATRSGTELLGAQAWIAESHDSRQEVQAVGA